MSNGPKVEDARAVLSTLSELLSEKVSKTLDTFPVPDADSHLVENLFIQMPEARTMTLHQLLLASRVLDENNDAPDIMNGSFSEGVNPFMILADLYEGL